MKIDLEFVTQVLIEKSATKSLSIGDWPKIKKTGICRFRVILIHALD
jgi:hypothetical protein